MAARTQNSPPPKPGPSPALKAQIDELGALEEEILPLKPKIARVEALRKAVAASFTGKPEDTTKLDGDKYVALITARKKQRTITSMTKLFNILKKAVFLENCSFTLGKVEELVPVDQQAGLIKEELSGPRGVTTYRIAA